MSLPSTIPTPIPTGDEDTPSSPSSPSSASSPRSSSSLSSSTPHSAVNAIGRYVLHGAIARGGMATVHAARLVAAEGVTRLVAAKRLHPHFTDDPEFVAMFRDEARIASRIHHPNVVPVLDVVHEGEELILVQEYVHGVPLSQLFKLCLAANDPIPIAIASAIVTGVLAGLHAAHEAKDEFGDPLEIVHRDVSPQNVIVSVDGIPRLVDFGIAKAKTSVHHTREGFFKGKLAYMSPEQLRGESVTRRADIYAAGVLLWEMLVNRRFYDGKNDADFVRAIAIGAMPTVADALDEAHWSMTSERWEDIEVLSNIVKRAMCSDPDDRYESALDMAAAVALAVNMASATEVSAFVRRVGVDYLDRRQKALVANEENWRAGLSANPNLSQHGHHVMIEDSHSVRSSGARVRLERLERATEPAFGGLTDPATTLASTSSSPPRFNHDVVERRALVPWTVIAGLLVVIGLLTGMVLVRPSALSPASPSSASSSSAPPLPANAVSLPPAATEAEVTTTTTTTPQSAHPPASVVTVVRFVPAPPLKIQTPPPQHVAAPIPTPIPTPTPASRSAECNPPFYFDGTKKVFKPACL